MAKTEFLQIRLSKEERDVISNIADENFLDPSTWARQVLLKEAKKQRGPLSEKGDSGISPERSKQDD